MDNGTNQRLPHLLVTETASTQRYTSPSGGRGKTTLLPERFRIQHAELLIQQIETARENESDIIGEQKAFGMVTGNGIYLSFESEPTFALKFESLEYQRSGIELCAVKKVEEKTVATVFVPEGKLERFLNKIIRYRDEDTVPRSPDKPSRPKEQDLIESISAIKLAALRELFTDDLQLFPSGNTAIWWETWLRHSDDFDYESFLRDHAEQLGMRVSLESIHFLDRTILLVYGTPEQMARSVHLLGSIAEVRKAKDTADFYTGMDDAIAKTLIPVNY